MDIESKFYNDKNILKSDPFNKKALISYTLYGNQIYDSDIINKSLEDRYYFLRDMLIENPLDIQTNIKMGNLYKDMNNEVESTIHYRTSLEMAKIKKNKKLIQEIIILLKPFLKDNSRYGKSNINNLF